MAKDNKTKLKLSNNNEHLQDIFSSNCYLELGTINYETIDRLLHKQLVKFDELAYFDIMQKGIGKMTSSSHEMAFQLPFMHFNNIVNKNKSLMLVITYGLILQRRGYKERFAPMVLIPVIMYFEEESVYFQMVSRPFINPFIESDNMEKIGYFQERLDSIYSIDRFILSLTKNNVKSIRLENYLTFVNLSYQEIQIHHDLYKFDNFMFNSLNERYVNNEASDNYNITPLDRIQRNIVALSKTGVSFAVAGYEGTGKTTALINIACNALKDGKRVLYISNNDNTLQKVYDLFKNKNLDSFVTLFNKPFKKINERALEPHRGQVIDRILKDELISNYETIEDYESCLSKKINNFALIELQNELILTPRPNNLFNDTLMGRAYHLHKYEVKEVDKALRNIEKLMDKLDSFKGSSFVEIPITNKITSASQPLELIQKIYINFCILKDEKELLEKKCGFEEITNYGRFKNVINNYSELVKTNIPSSWLTKIDGKVFTNYELAKENFNHLRELLNEYRRVKHIIENDYNFPEMFNIKDVIKTILDIRFNKHNIQAINQVLNNYNELAQEASKAFETVKKIEANFSLLCNKLNIQTSLDRLDLINQIIDFIFVLDKDYYTKQWLKFENFSNQYQKITSIEKILDEYDEAMKVYKKYFDNESNLDNQISLLEKRNKTPNSKYRKTNVNELLNKLYYIRKYNLKLNTLKKEYLDLCGTEYVTKVHISNIYKDFIDKYYAISDGQVRNQIGISFANFRKVEIIELLQIAKQLKEAILNTFVSYDYFESYKLVKSSKNLIEKNKNIKHVYEYSKQIKNTHEIMRSVIKDKTKKVTFESYLYIDDSIDTINNLKELIDNNQEFEFYFEGLFDRTKTDLNLIEKTIEQFSLYQDLFVNPNSLIASFDNLNDRRILAHLNNSNSVIEELKDLFSQYVKIFKDVVSKFFYDSIESVIDTFKKLADSKDELVVYLKICKEMKVLLHYQLISLNNYIIDNWKTMVADRFKYTYCMHLYKAFLKKNPTFEKNTKLEQVIERTLNLEGDLLDSNVEVLKVSNYKNYRTGRARNLNYNQYIEKNNGSKFLYLSDTIIANTFLDIDLFDMVLIDDAQLASANQYYKVVNCKQVIVAGSEQIQSAISNNLVSRIRENSIIHLTYRYSRTPLALLAKMNNVKGRFYSSNSLNNGVSVSKENPNSIILKLFKTNNNCKINFFTASLEKMGDIFQTVGNILYDRGFSTYEIYMFFKNNINIADLKDGYTIDSDFNILDLSTYQDVNDEFTSRNMANILLSCSSQIIIIDNKNILSRPSEKRFIELVNDIVVNKDINLLMPKNTIVEKISGTLLRYRIRTLGSFLPLSMVVEYENSLFGIMLLENPNMTEFTIINEFREYKSNEFPIITIWLSDLINDYSGVIQKVIQEIRS